MSIGKLGSYSVLLQRLHAAVSGKPMTQPAAPVSTPPVPVPWRQDTYQPAPLRSIVLPPPPPQPPDPARYFISQVWDVTWNPDAPTGNRNCGPATLAMALRALGLTPPGLTNPADTEQWVDTARRAMEGDTNSGKFTSDDDMLKGAIASGAQAAKVNGIDQVTAALKQGKLVALAGNPQPYEQRLSNQQYDHFNGGHFILVSGLQGDRFVVSDPQAHIPSFTVSRDELTRYMAFKDWNVGVAIWRS